ncbi:MAG: pilus assembly protein PilP [Dokdonella sp.]|uniref:pilus assembly protein PilP n=2 Tax=Dokdonella sp. TaxID=2291710 RepID=UPI003BB02650
MKSPFAITLRLAAVLMMLAVLSGCMSGKEEVEKWVQQEKAKKGTPIDPPPAIKTFETFEYTLRAPDDRDPFDLPSREEDEEAASAGPRPDQNRTREPLESYPLDGLKMVGTLGSPTAPEGLLKDPEGVIRRVHVGNYVGQNYGRITAINEGQIDLVELVPNQTGGWVERQTSISLADASK